MTAIEFFDRTPIENIVSAITTKPDKIIFVGDGNAMGGFKGAFARFLNLRKLDIEIVYRKINRNKLSDVIDVLADIIKTEKDCVFDLTGGDDLVLVAMGIVSQKYPEKNIQMQRFNVNNNVVTDCDGDGKIIYEGVPSLSIEEQIMIHGGVIKSQNDITRIDDNLANDIELIWELIRKRPKRWNGCINSFGEIIKRCSQDSTSLDMCIDTFAFEQQNAKAFNESLQTVLSNLLKHKLIRGYVHTGRYITFSFKNKYVKSCMTKAGTALELRTLLAAQRAVDKRGNSIYNETANSVEIDWNGGQNKTKDSENEVDVVLMHGLVPFFISCKNGKVDKEEPYKLNAVTERFGGLYAKRVLISTYAHDNEKGRQNLIQRAKDMKIKLIIDAHHLTSEQFDEMVKRLINGSDESLKQKKGV